MDKKKLNQNYKRNEVIQKERDDKENKMFNLRMHNKYIRIPKDIGIENEIRSQKLKDNKYNQENEDIFEHYFQYIENVNHVETWHKGGIATRGTYKNNKKK